MTKKVIVAGVGMIPFKNQALSENYNVMGESCKSSTRGCWTRLYVVQQAYVGYVYGDSTTGQPLYMG